MEVQTDKASAKFKDGVLEIKIPKTEEAKKKEKKVNSTWERSLKIVSSLEH